MTREEAIALIEKWMNIISEEGLHFAKEYRQAFIMAIKALEQESVLDKIRAEIEKKIKKRLGLNHTRAERERNDAFLEVLEILDKYKAESERV